MARREPLDGELASGGPSPLDGARGGQALHRGRPGVLHHGVRARRADQAQGLPTITGDSDDIHPAGGRQQGPQALPGTGAVVGDHDAQRGPQRPAFRVDPHVNPQDADCGAETRALPITCVTSTRTDETCDSEAGRLFRGADGSHVAS